MATGDGVRRVTLIMAMREEAMPIVDRFGLKLVDPPRFVDGAPFVAWMGDAGAVRLCVCWCGHDKRFGVNNVATTAAAVAAYAAVAAFGAPDLMISAGTAGAFAQRGAALNDVFLSSKCIFHSRRIPGEDGELEEYGFGHIRSPNLSALAAAVGLKVGVVSTSDSLDCTPTDLALLLGEGASVKEMEAASVAWVCQQLRVPFFALKAVTDLVDGGEATREEFERNLAAAAAELQHRFALLLELVAGKPLSHWAGAGAGGAAAAVERAAPTQFLPVPPPRPVAAEQPLGLWSWSLAILIGVSLAWLSGRRSAAGGGGRSVGLSRHR
mmetsp:Transcript_25412/g.81262  ORF Transcript_25412/g.81262 Transcript_25412/m.81262 type:complete len:325 (+) Transcript_25412:25-999(+)